jgi:hypothetical protein
MHVGVGGNVVLGAMPMPHTTPPMI